MLGRMISERGRREGGGGRGSGREGGREKEFKFETERGGMNIYFCIE